MRRSTTRQDGVCGAAGAGADHRRRLRVRVPRRQGQLLRHRGAYGHTPLHNAHAQCTCTCTCHVACTCTCTCHVACTCTCTCHVACTCTCTHGMCMYMSMSSSTSTSTSRPALHDHARAGSPLTSPQPHTRRATRRATPPTSTWRASRQAAACRMLHVSPYISLCLTIPRCISLHLPPGMRLEDAPASFFSGAALGPTGRFGSYAAPQAEGVRVRVRCGARVRVRRLRVLGSGLGAGPG